MGMRSTLSAHHACPAPGPICNTITHRGPSPFGGGTHPTVPPQGTGLSSGQGCGGSGELLRAVSSCEPVPGVSRELCKAHVSVQCLLRGKPSPVARTACPGAAGHRSRTVTPWRGDWPGKPTLGTPCCCCLAPAVTWASPVATQPLSWWLQVPVCIPRPLLPLHLPGVAAGATCGFLLATKEFFFT